MTGIIYFLLGLQVFQTYLIMIPLIFPLIYIFYKTPHTKIFTINFFLLAAFSVMYAAIGGIYGTVNVYYAGLIIISYLLGSVIATQKKSSKEYYKVVLYYLIGVGIHGILTYYYNYSRDIFDRNIIEFWSKTPFSATGQSVLLNSFYSLSPYFLFVEKRKIVKITMIVFIALIIAYTFYLGTRSSLIVFLLSCGIYYIYTLYKEKTFRINKILTHFVVIATIVIMYSIDFLSIKTIIENSVMFTRFNDDAIYLSDIYRFDLLRTSIEYLFRRPFGNVQEYTFAHNLWLDVARLTGIFPFILLVAFSISSYKNLLEFVKIKSILYDLRIMIFLILFGALIIFFFEPILETAFSFFIYFVFSCGFISVKVLETRKQRNCE